MLSCQEIDDTLSPIFTPLTANKQYPGILVGVTTGSADGHCYSSFGNVPLYQGRGTVATEDIVFFIGSNTKVVTATLLALGNFNKSVLPVSGATLVTDLLPPGARINFFEGQALHLWHLATHSAGYPDPPCGQTALGNFTFAQLVTFLQHFTPPYGPGKFWHYSDAGFALLGVLMSHAFTQGPGTSTDTIFDTTYSNWPLVATNNVLSPLRMRRTSPTPTPTPSSIAICRNTATACSSLTRKCSCASSCPTRRRPRPTSGRAAISHAGRTRNMMRSTRQPRSSSILSSVQPCSSS